MKKNVLAIATLGVLSVVVFWSYYYGFHGEQASANPDFICVKSVTGQSCNISSCGTWQNDGTRVCSWKRVTKVWYYHTRTTCNSGYSKSGIQWSTNVSNTAANYLIDNWESDKLYSDYTKWASWRHSNDFNYETEDCSITEVDDKAPSATITSSWTSIN
jgi:hypothetical protein